MHVTLICFGGRKFNVAKNLLKAQVRQSWEGREVTVTKSQTSKQNTTGNRRWLVGCVWWVVCVLYVWDMYVRVCNGYMCLCDGGWYEGCVCSVMCRMCVGCVMCVAWYMHAQIVCGGDGGGVCVCLWGRTGITEGFVEEVVSEKY